MLVKVKWVEPIIEVYYKKFTTLAKRALRREEQGKLSKNVTSGGD